jgi:hypothetical protein
MEVVKAIRSILVASGDVTTICGQRIYAYFAPQEAAAPYVVVSVVSVRPSDCKNGASRLDTYRVQIDSTTKSAATTSALDQAVRLAIDRVGSGQVGAVAIDGIKYDNSQMLPEYERELRVIASDFDVRVARNITLPLLPNVPGLQEFTDDEAAILGGLVPGDFYVIAEGSDVANAGIIKRVMG